MDELYSTAGDYGLRTLADPDHAKVDIVFVHGLTGNRETTWTHKPTRTFWPQVLLPQELPEARILTFGYDADIIGALSNAGSNTLRDHGKSLAHDLSLYRMKTRSNHRPLIFVAHSLGGLVTEQTLLISRGGPKQHQKDLVENTVAIAFLGTPHAGSNKANWATPLTRLARVLRRTNEEIVKVLEPGSEVLAGLQQEFHTMLEDRRRNRDGRVIEIFCFYEELAVEGLGKIVEDHSAILSGYENRSIHGNHMQMTRFGNSQDPGFQAVSGQLWLWMEELETHPKLEPEPARRPNTRPQLTFTGGGAVFNGSQHAGRDINFNHSTRYA